jgi:hypothetical protein
MFLYFPIRHPKGLFFNGTIEQAATAYGIAIWDDSWKFLTEVIFAY